MNALRHAVIAGVFVSTFPSAALAAHTEPAKAKKGDLLPGERLVVTLPLTKRLPCLHR
jgi:hypothetical protein